MIRLATVSQSSQGPGTPPSPGGGGGGGPYPQGLTPSGTIHFDLRTSLQGVSTTTAMRNLFADPTNTVATLADNVDGTGRKWARGIGTATCQEGSTGTQWLVIHGTNGVNLTSYTDFYVQWRMRFGRFSGDTGGNGATDYFSISDGLVTCAPDNQVGCKMLYFRETGGATRFDSQWFNTHPRRQWVGGPSPWNSNDGYGNTYDPSLDGGVERVITIRTRFTDGGVHQFWVDGTMTGEVTGINFVTGGWTTLNAIQLYNVWDQVPYDQTVYFADHVIWTP